MAIETTNRPLGSGTLRSVRLAGNLILAVISLWAITMPRAALAEGPEIRSVTTIAPYGQSVDWSAARDRIVSERVGVGSYYEIVTIDPDGSNETYPLRGRPGCPQRHAGNAAWHPSGQYIAFTAMNDNIQGRKWNDMGVPGTGLNNNLWLADVDAGRCWKLTGIRTRLSYVRGVIHPQFSPDGAKLLWAERIGYLKGSSWGEWSLKLADLTWEGGLPRLANVQTFQPGAQHSFYESSGFSADGKRVLFSGNPVLYQPEAGQDVYQLDLGSGQIGSLTSSLTDWDEQAHLSPDGRYIVWMSSTGYKFSNRSAPIQEWVKYLITELWIMDADGGNKRPLTHFNQPGYPESAAGRCVAGDSAWNADGTKLAISVGCDTPSGWQTSLVVVDLGNSPP